MPSENYALRRLGAGNGSHHVLFHKDLDADEHALADCGNPGQKPCEEVCEGSERHFIGIANSNIGARLAVQFPRGHHGHAFFAANQSCSWEIALPKPAVKGRANGELSVYLTHNATLKLSWHGDSHYMENGTYVLVAPLPLKVTFHSGRSGAGGFTFIWKEDVWVKNPKRLQLLLTVLRATYISSGCLLAVVLFALIIFRHRLRSIFRGGGFEATFVRRLRLWSGLTPPEMDQLCPVESYAVEEGIEAESCPICLASLDNSQSVRRMACPAHHTIHAECAEEWLRRQGTCPVCRFQHVPLLVGSQPAEEVISLEDLARDLEMQDRHGTESPRWEYQELR